MAFDHDPILLFFAAIKYPAGKTGGVFLEFNLPRTELLLWCAGS
jgi:hypothetical protein